MSEPGSSEPISYAEVTDDAYGHAFASSCTAARIRRGVLLRGTCPRCAHGMSFPVITEVFQTAVPEEQSASGADSEEKPLLCTCNGTHPGRPAREEGCGAYWNVRLSTQVSQ
jgi:hypothetical protein